MKTDTQTTGKLYPPIAAYYKGKNHGRYFSSTMQFKRCRDFVAYLQDKYPGYQFTAFFDKH